MKLLSLLILLISFNTLGQDVFFVKDHLTQEAIPFVKIYPNDSAPFIADLDGAFSLTGSTSYFSVKYSGYRDTIINVSILSDSIIYMRLNVQEVEEILVVAGENPAHRIIKKAIDNRKRNHPLKNDAFTYTSYSKFIFDVKSEGINEEPDSTLGNSALKFKKFIDKQHLFMMESASKRTFIPPAKDQEEITAYKVSGLKNPIFSTFANSMQSFSFYDKQISLMGLDYLNPLAEGGIKRYLFILEDSTIHANDTTYTIYYRPRINKIFKGVEGRMYINTNGYAIEKVIASPHNPEALIKVKIVQEYEFVDGEKWFPTKLSTEVDFGQALNLGLDSSSVVGTGHAYIDNIDINPEQKLKIRNKNISILTSPDANDLKNSEWETLRRYKITEKEKRTYEKIDSLSKVNKIEQKINALMILGSGKIPMGKFNMDLSKVLRFNYYEELRLGMGLETSEKLMRNIVLGAYFGWGTGDKDWKYGGYTTFHFNKKRGIKLDVRFQQDVSQRGGISYVSQDFNFLSSESFKSYLITRMDRQRLGEMAFNFDIKANMSISVFGNYQRIEYTDGYQYMPILGTTMNLLNADLAETGIELKWNILEKYMLLGNFKLSQGQKYPTIKLKAVKGWKNVFDSDYDYVRLNAEIGQTINFIRLGKLVLKAEAGKTIGETPLFLSHTGQGTGVDWLVSVKNSFETMAPASFYNKEFVAFFTRFSFLSIRTKANWNRPKFSLHHALGYGNFSSKEEHTYSFKSMDKGYYEVGVICDGILSTNSSSLGLGLFYNYGEYADLDWKLNIVPKLSFTFNVF